MFWNLFRKRRREDQEEPTEKAAAQVPARQSSKRSRRRISAQTEKQPVPRPPSVNKRQGFAAGKEDAGLARRSSVEKFITALPITHKLDTSPHLRPVDGQKPQIPYNFSRPYSLSQTSIQPTDTKPSRPQTLRSKRSTTLIRRHSSKRANHNDQIREEEIRAMTQPIPIPKRGADGILRTDSKKYRGLGPRGSNISLPPEASVHSSMSGVVEQRGWEVGLLDVFNPRPAVRLSGTPQYVHYGSLPGTAYQPPATPKPDKEKRPATRDTIRKRDTIGEAADEFDASDLRMLMDRDKKRRERRDKERQEKLDRKLRSRNGRNRGDSEARRKEAKEKAREGEARRQEEERWAHGLMTPPADVHPALRDGPVRSEADVVGLGIDPALGPPPADSQHDAAHALPTIADLGTQGTATPLDYKPEQVPVNPFADPVQADDIPTESAPRMPGAFDPLGSPFEDPIVKTPQPRELSQTRTPPLSPASEQPPRALSSLSQVETIDAPTPPLVGGEERRLSEPKDKRMGGWASFFRRGPTIKRPGESIASSPSETTSFSNVSRESMRHQPLPAHLVDAPAQPRPRPKSGTPVRTQSRFREDLPELPTPPPDMPSGDVAQAAAAAAAAAARRTKRHTTAVDTPRQRSETPDAASINRNDTPVSPSARGHGLVSESLASVGSEGSWLASSGKRQSAQSGLSRGQGSLTKRKPEFAGSFEELGGDRDAEYFPSMAAGSAAAQTRKQPRSSSPALAGATPDEESEDGDLSLQDVEGPTSDPLKVHGSVRRHPTIVHRDPRIKSREGLLTDSQSAEVLGGGGDDDDGDDEAASFAEPETPEPQIRSARSVNYGSGSTHARQVSAGNAKLLDLSSKRQSGEPPSARPSRDVQREENV